MNFATETEAQSERLRVTQLIEGPRSIAVTDPSALARRLLKGARFRQSRAVGVPSDLTVEQVEAIVARAGGRCEVTGIPFADDRHKDQRWAPFAPSLDRVDHRVGYTATNCRLVVLMVNVALNQWGDDLFWDFIGQVAENMKFRTIRVTDGGLQFVIDPRRGTPARDVFMPATSRGAHVLQLAQDQARGRRLGRRAAAPRPAAPNLDGSR